MPTINYCTLQHCTKEHNTACLCIQNSICVRRVLHGCAFDAACTCIQSCMCVHTKLHVCAYNAARVCIRCYKRVHTKLHAWAYNDACVCIECGCVSRCVCATSTNYTKQPQTNATVMHKHTHTRKHCSTQHGRAANLVAHTFGAILTKQGHAYHVDVAQAHHKLLAT